MSTILPVLGQIDSTTREYAIVFGATVLSLLLAGWLGTHHRRSVVGPSRLHEEDRPGRLWLLVAIGFYSLFLPGLIFQLGWGHSAPTTAPATQISPRATAMLSVAQPLAIWLAVVIGGALIWPVWRDRLGLSLRRLPAGLSGGLLGAMTVIPPMFAIAILTQKCLEWIGIEHPNAHALLRAMDADREPVVQILGIVSAILLAPICEELLFRGLLQTAIAHTIRRSSPDPASRWIAIFLTSVVFTLFHPEAWMMPPILALSLCLGYVYERTGNLWSCMLLHAAFNSANVILFWSQAKH